MEKKAVTVGGGGELIDRLPETILLEILSRLDLDSLCSSAPVCRALRSAVSQTLSLISSLDLSGFSPNTEILNTVIRENNTLRSLTLDCSRLDDSSIRLFAKEHLQELVLLKCFLFTSNIFIAIGEKCPNLRLLTLEVVYQYDLESTSSCKKAMEQMLNRCLHLESLCIKFPSQCNGPADSDSFQPSLPKNIKLLLLQPVTNRLANLLIPVGLGLQSLTLVLDIITDELLISITGTLRLLAELCLEDRPMEEPSRNSDLTNGGLQLLGFCRNLTSLSLSRSKENCPTTFRRVNDVGMFLLVEGCKQLESVRLSGFSRVTDAGYASILHSCKNLRRFEIANAFFLSDLAFHDLADAPSSLTDVRLISCSLITSDTAESLSLCRNLEVLDLSSCRSIADVGLYSISNLCKLTTLDLGGADITDSGLSALGGSTSPIASLRLRGCKRITDRGIGLMLRGDGTVSKTLSSLDLGFLPGVSDRAITTVVEVCRELRDLCIRNCFFISDASIRALGSSVGFAGERRPIRKLDLHNCCGLSSDSFSLLARPSFPGLRWLGVGNTRLSGKGKEKLVELSRDRRGLSVCMNGCEMGCKIGWVFHESV